MTYVELTVSVPAANAPCQVPTYRLEVRQGDAMFARRCEAFDASSGILTPDAWFSDHGDYGLRVVDATTQ